MRIALTSCAKQNVVLTQDISPAEDLVMRILVTGANGFLGSWLSREIVARGHELFALHRKTSDLTPLQGVPFQSKLGDVTDRESVLNAVEGMEAVFHVAAVIAYDKSQWDKMHKVNVGGTQNVVDACVKLGVKRMVHTSSVVTVAEAPLDPNGREGRGLANEDSIYNMSHYNLGYFESKKKAEDIVLKAARRTSAGLDAVVVNPAVVFGAGDGVKGSRKMHLKVAAGKFPFYVDGGLSVVHVGDVVQAELAALEKGKRGERYILSGENLTVKEAFEILARAGGHQPPSRKLPLPAIRLLGSAGDFAQKLGFKVGINSERAITSTLYLWFDNSKARRELGFNPKPAHTAIEESVLWCREQGLLR